MFGSAHYAYTKTPKPRGPSELRFLVFCALISTVSLFSDSSSLLSPCASAPPPPPHPTTTTTLPTLISQTHFMPVFGGRDSIISGARQATMRRVVSALTQGRRLIKATLTFHFSPITAPGWWSRGAGGRGRASQIVSVACQRKLRDARDARSSLELQVCPSTKKQRHSSPTQCVCVCMNTSP